MRYIRSLELLGCVLVLGWVVVGCSPTQRCVNGISNLSLDSNNSPCTKDCDCSNQRYEGVCNNGICIARKRAECNSPLEKSPCAMLPSPKAGFCRTGLQTCRDTGLNGMYMGDCKVEIVPERGALCTDGKDNDCDGKVDQGDTEDCKDFCEKGKTEECGSSVGACKKGTRTCKDDNTWGPCEGKVKPSSEECNGRDDDCDGETDKDADGKNLQRPCYGGQKGCEKQEGEYQCTAPCKAGLETCEAGSWSKCKGALLPEKEECNGKDDDCDGKTDENEQGEMLSRACYNGAEGCAKAQDGSYKCLAPCQAGIQVCTSGVWPTCSGEVLPEKEVCNDKDDNCDGKVDEDLPGGKCPYSGPSGTEGNGVCKAGLRVCRGGVWKCVDEVLPAKAEVCHNGKDDECNGKIDDGCSWVLSFGGMTRPPHTTYEYDKGLDLVVDGQNNVYVTGEFRDTQAFGSKQLTSQGDRDAFLVKFDVNRAASWATAATSKKEVEGRELALLGGTHLAWLGTFGGAMTIGSSSLTNTASYDAFVAKTDLQGKEQWTVKSGGGGTEIGWGVSAGQNGVMYATLTFNSSITLGSKTFTATSTNGLIIKYDGKGSVLWANQIRGGDARASSLCTNQKGDVYAVGRYADTGAEFGLETGAPTLKNDGQVDKADGFVAKLDASTGKFLWAKGVHGRLQDVTAGCAVDASGNVVLTGYFREVVRFGDPGTLQLTSTASSNYTNGYIAKADKNGTFLWAKSFGDTQLTLGKKVALDGAGNVYATGSFQASAFFGNKQLLSQGDFDIYVTKLDSTGKFIWSLSAGGSSVDVGLAIKVAPNGQVVVGGYHSANASFGPLSQSGSVVYMRSFVWWLKP